MRLAWFPGCKISFGLADYGLAVEKVMTALGVTLVPLPFNCCGNPARGKNLAASVLAAMKNLTLAQEAGLDILTPCKCCFGQLKHGRHWYLTEEQLKEKIDLTLAEEGRAAASTGLVQDPVSGRLEKRPVRVRHLLDFLYKDYGVRRLGRQIRQPFPGTDVVLQQGCHALRPYTVTQFDNPSTPLIFRKMAGMTGLNPLDWSGETECCGEPAWESNRELAFTLTRSKQRRAAMAGARFICTACTHCQIQYARVPPASPREGVEALPFVFFLGRALGLKGPLFDRIRNNHPDNTGRTPERMQTKPLHPANKIKTDDEYNSHLKKEGLSDERKILLHQPQLCQRG